MNMNLPSSLTLLRESDSVRRKLARLTILTYCTFPETRYSKNMIRMASATILKRGTEKRHQSRVNFKLKPYTKREHRRVVVYMEWRILIYGSLWSASIGKQKTK